MKEYSRYKYNIQDNNPPFHHLLSPSHSHHTYTYIYKHMHTNMNRYSTHSTKLETCLRTMESHWRNWTFITLMLTCFSVCVCVCVRDWVRRWGYGDGTSCCGDVARMRLEYRWKGRWRQCQGLFSVSQSFWADGRSLVSVYCHRDTLFSASLHFSLILSPSLISWSGQFVYQATVLYL